MVFYQLAFIIATFVGNFYAQNDYIALIIVSAIAALVEAYGGQFWNSLGSIRARVVSKPPLWFFNLYPDDNLTIPLSFALMLKLFGA